MCREAVPITGAAYSFHAARFGAELPSQRADHDIDDIAGRWAPVPPHGFHEVVTADGLSRAFLQLLHHTEFERGQSARPDVNINS
jgi:hypothetical protein